MDILLLPLGTFGDVNPFVGLGQALLRRGHRVTLGASAVFEDLVDRSGLEFVALSTKEEYESAFDNPDFWHPNLGYLRSFREVIVPAMRRQYDFIAERRQGGELLTIGSTAGLGARIAHDKLGVPLVTLHLQPLVVWSEHRSPVVGPMLLGDWVPRPLKRLQYRLAEMATVYPIVLDEANTFRQELSLPPLSDARQLWNSPQRAIGLFPEWFAPRQPDWPDQLQLTGFPMWDDSTDLDAGLLEFVESGEPPIVFTFGTGMMDIRRFFGESVEACRRLGRRGIFLSKYAGDLPEDLPESMIHRDYVPLGRLLPRTAALVHHGGIGTLSQAMAAAVPQLVVPLSFDQPDNAARLTRLGVAQAIKPRSYRAPVVARRLQRILDSARIGKRCTEVAGLFVGVDAIKTTCDAIEEQVRASASSAA